MQEGIDISRLIPPLDIAFAWHVSLPVGFCTFYSLWTMCSAVTSPERVPMFSISIPSCFPAAPEIPAPAYA